MNQQSSAIIWFVESLCLMDLLDLYSGIPVSWQVHGKRLWTQCGQCSVLGGRARTSHQHLSCPSRPPRSRAWPVCSAAWTDKFWVRPRDTRQLWNETSIRKLLRSASAAQNSNKPSRKLCHQFGDIIYHSVLSRTDHNKIVNLIRGSPVSSLL